MLPFRCFSLGLVLCVPHLIPAQVPDFGKRVTYTTKAITLHSVLEDLSKQSGVKLRATPDMEEEPLILCLHDVPLKEAMDKMADVFAADWVDHNGFFRLERSREKEAKIKQAQFEKRRQLIEKSLSDLRSFQEQRPIDAKTAADLVQRLDDMQTKALAGQEYDSGSYRNLIWQLPMTRLSTAVLSQMDAGDLARIPEGARAVFSTSPNGLQKQLAEPSAEILDRYLRESQLLEDTVSKLPQDRQSYVNIYVPRGDRTVKRIVVGAWAEPHQNHIEVTTQFCDLNGDLIHDDFQTLGWTPQYETEAVKQFVALRLAAQKDGFELDPIAKEISPYTIIQPNMERRPLSAAALDFLLHPTKYEPLSLGTSQIVLHTAETEHLNAIVLATDLTEGYALNSARIGKTNLATFASIAEASAEMTIRVEDGWIIGKPNDPQDAAESRVPRPALEAFAQAITQRGYVGIDDAADFCAEVPATTNIVFARRYAAYLMPDRRLGGMTWSPNMLRFFGMLTPEQRDAAKSKLVVRLGDLSDDQKEAARRFVFDGLPLAQNEDVGGNMRGDRHERTDFLPLGLLDRMQIEIKDESPLTFMAQIEVGGKPDTMSFAGDQAVYMLGLAQRPEVFHNNPPLTIKKICPRKQRQLSVAILDGKKSIRNQCSEDNQPATSMMTIEDYLASLPDAERNKLEGDIARLIQQMEAHAHEEPVGKPPSGAKPPV